MLNTDLFEQQIKELIVNKASLTREELIVAVQSIAMLKAILELKLEKAEEEFREIYKMLHVSQETEEQKNGK